METRLVTNMLLPWGRKLCHSSGGEELVLTKPQKSTAFFFLTTRPEVQASGRRSDKALAFTHPSPQQPYAVPSTGEKLFSTDSQDVGSSSLS